MYVFEVRSKNNVMDSNIIKLIIIIHYRIKVKRALNGTVSQISSDPLRKKGTLKTFVQFYVHHRTQCKANWQIGDE